MKEARIDYLFDGICLTTALMSVEQIFQIILLVLGCISSLVSIAYSLYKWLKKAKEDGKITKEEFKEGIDIATNGAKEINEQIKEAKDEIQRKD